MKTQLLISPESKMSYGIAWSKGKTHDFKIFKDSEKHIPSDIKILGDSGYQGIRDIHFNSCPPIKKKEKKLTKRQKLYNHLLSKKRIVLENIIRLCKIFRITKKTYRGKHKIMKKYGISLVDL